MNILVAEYASALGIGGTCEVEGRAMLRTLVESFERSGHNVAYPTCGPVLNAGTRILVDDEDEFLLMIETIKVDAGLLIAPDELSPGLLRTLEEHMNNLGCGPEAAALCADKLECTQRLKENGIPVADVVIRPEGCETGCHRYVIKPRFGCGSEGVRISSSPRAPEGFIATRYIEGLHLSASFICGRSFLPLTINRQLIEFEGDGICYNGSQVPYNTPRAPEIWSLAEKAAKVLDLRGYAGIDFVVGDLPRVVDVNARPTTSIIGISRVMKEEIAELILLARFGRLPDEVSLNGEVWTFTKEDLKKGN